MPEIEPAKVHYVPDLKQHASTLCGLDDPQAITVWERRRVTCERCARRFDESLTALRRIWIRAKRVADWE